MEWEMNSSVSPLSLVMYGLDAATLIRRSHQAANRRFSSPTTCPSAPAAPPASCPLCSALTPSAFRVLRAISGGFLSPPDALCASAAVAACTAR